MYKFFYISMCIFNVSFPNITHLFYWKLECFDVWEGGRKQENNNLGI